MRFQYNGQTYRLGFKHEDNRFEDVVDQETGEIIGRRPAPKKVLKAKGPGRTTALLWRQEGVDAEGHPVWDLLDTVTVRCSPKDSFNRAHGRWYAVEALIRSITNGGSHPVLVAERLARDTRFHRAIRVAHYSNVAWRPDGRDGFKIGMLYREPVLERVAPSR